MVFPDPRGRRSAPPPQLHEALPEGLVRFAILWLYSRSPRLRMAVSGLFLLGYSVFRILVELVRVPDAELGYLALDSVTMGQILSLTMVIVGAGLLVWRYRIAPESDNSSENARASSR